MARASAERSLRGRVAVIGIGETDYFRHGASPDPEFKLALKAILAACADAGIDPRDIDGFASYSDDRSEASRLAAALGIHRLRSATMQWGGGGGGCCAAVANAAASIVAGLADCVVVFRSLAQGQYGRFGQTTGIDTISGEKAFLMPYGVLAPPQRFAMRVQRYMHEHGVRQEALRAIALASYHHAQSNPRAVMYGKPLNEAGSSSPSISTTAVWKTMAPQRLCWSARNGRGILGRNPFSCWVRPSAPDIAPALFRTIRRSMPAPVSIRWRRTFIAWLGLDPPMSAWFRLTRISPEVS
jgi:hypothetical protein